MDAEKNGHPTENRVPSLPLITLKKATSKLSENTGELLLNLYLGNSSYIRYRYWLLKLINMIIFKLKTVIHQNIPERQIFKAGKHNQKDYYQEYIKNS